MQPKPIINASGFSLAEYVRSHNIQQGMDSWKPWMQIFQNFGRGDHMEPEVLQKMTQTTESSEDAVDAGAASQARPFGKSLDQDLKKELDNPSVRERVQDLASKPELLAKVVKENSLVKQLAAMNPVVAQVINSPEALQKMFSKEMLDVLQQGQKPDDAALESILESSKHVQIPK